MGFGDYPPGHSMNDAKGETERLLERMLIWLEQVAADLYGLILKVTTERDVPQSVVT